jgi:hypothetical protein
MVLKDFCGMQVSLHFEPADFILLSTVKLSAMLLAAVTLLFIISMGHIVFVQVGWDLPKPWDF